MNNLENKTVLITGASRGIGRAIAREFAANNANLILASRTESGLKTVRDELSSRHNNRVHIIPCDITSEKIVNDLVAECLSMEDRIDILVNSAGTASFHPITETGEEEWDAMMNVNLKGVFLLTRALLPHMIKNQAGHIINIISSAGRRGFTNCGAYCASKFGLTGFTDVLRQEVRKHNIHVTAVYPGAVDTGLWNAIEGDWDRELMIPPESVARAVLNVCANSDRCMCEEIVLMPEQGDL